MTISHQLKNEGLENENSNADLFSTEEKKMGGFDYSGSTLQGQHISSDKSRDVDLDIAEGTTILIEEHTTQDRDGHSTAVRSINQILKENALYQSKNVNSNT